MDISARLIGQWLSERLGQQFIIDNRPGAGGNMATEAVVRAPADGYTLLVAYASSAINATLFEKLTSIRTRRLCACVVRQPNIPSPHSRCGWALLHGLEQVLVLPSRDSALRTCRAARFDGAARTCRRPIAAQHLAVLRAGVTIGELLTGRAAVDIF